MRRLSFHHRLKRRDKRNDPEYLMWSMIKSSVNQKYCTDVPRTVTYTTPRFIRHSSLQFLNVQEYVFQVG